MLASYHNHTTWSDGEGTVAQVVERARQLGVDEVGISDHLDLHPSGATPPWSMSPEAVEEYVGDITAYGDLGEPFVRLGLEVDWWPERLGELSELLAEYPFDFLIGSIHEIDGFRLDLDPEQWIDLDADDRNGIFRKYWLALPAMAASGLFDIVGHLDLPKKSGYRPTADLDREIGDALDAIADADMAVELNVSGWYKPCQEAYPSDRILRRCQRRGIPALLASDAHHPDGVVVDFDRGLRHLRDAGYTELVRFEGRERRACPIQTIGSRRRSR